MSPVFKDQMGRAVKLDRYPPRRIVSLVPSQTELLAWLGLEDQLVGITRFCVHPESVYRSVTRVGGTKNVHFDRLAAQNPDLIIGNKEENEQEQIEQLASRYPVWMSDIHGLSDALDMIRRLGILTGQAEKAESLAERLEQDFQNLAIPAADRIRAAYFIWNDPMMVVGNDTFIDEMLKKAGFQNVFAQLSRYPQISVDQLQQADPDVILLSSEPFPFKEKHMRQFQQICPKAVTIKVDGELFSWYGNRLLQSAAYFRNLRTMIQSALKEC